MYILVGTLIPFNEKDAKARYEQEVRDRRAMGLEGPVQLETTKPNAQTLYYVEVMAEKSNAPCAIMRIISRIENQHKCKAVYRVHADRAQELTGERTQMFFENQGITVTSTAGYDSNANGRAERAVSWFLQKARTLLSSNIRSEKFQNKLKSLWTFAVQHAGEVHRREVFGEPRCKYEFGQVVLSRVKDPSTKLTPRMHRVLFLGFAPNVTNGYFVMKQDDKIELTSNIADESNFDASDALMEQRPGTSTENPPQPQPLHDYPYTDRERWKQ